MKSLIEYVKENRKENSTEVQFLNNFGELFIDTRALYFSVKTNSRDYKVFGFMSIPTGKMPKGGFPAVILLHGGNGAAYAEFTHKWALKGYVAIAIDLYNQCGSNLLNRCVENETKTPKAYGSIDDMHENDPWLYFYCLAGMGAVDVLLQTGKVNPNKIGSVGLSWGGFLNLALTSVEKRIKASSIIYSSAFIHLSKWGQSEVKLGKLTEEDKKEYIKYIEPSNYIKNIKIPTLFTAGLDDLAFSASLRQKTADAIKGPTYFACRKNFPHGNFFGFEQNESIEFFDLIFKGKKIPQPELVYKDGKYLVNSFYKDSKLEVVYTNQIMDGFVNPSFKRINVLNKDKLILKDDVTAVMIIEKHDGLIWSSNLLIK